MPFGSQPVSAQPALETAYTFTGAIALNTVLMTLDCDEFQSVSVQIAAISSGAIAPEWSNNGTTWVAATHQTPSGGTGTTLSSAGIYVFPVYARYLRLRVSIAISSGTTTISAYQFNDARAFWQSSQTISGSLSSVSTVSSISAGSNAIGDVGVQYRASSTGAASIAAVSSPATPAATSVKATSGRLVGIQLTNTAASARFVKVFNASAPTLGTTAALYELAIPAGGIIAFDLPGGIAHSTAITYSVTSARGLTDNTATGLAAGDVVGILAYA